MVPERQGPRHRKRPPITKREAQSPHGEAGRLTEGCSADTGLRTRGSGERPRHEKAGALGVHLQETGSRIGFPAPEEEGWGSVSSRQMS